MKIFSRILTSILVLLPATAFAHPGHEAAGLASGFLHPFSGLDHILAMVAVGLWAAQMGGKARLLLPLAFVSAVSLFGFFGARGLSISGLEAGILSSGFILGVFLTTAFRPPVFVGMILAAAFAAFHGTAHGAGMPAAASGWWYGAGFAAATFTLLLVGLFTALILPLAINKISPPLIYRFSGISLLFGTAALLFSRLI